MVKQLLSLRKVARVSGLFVLPNFMLSSCKLNIDLTYPAGSWKLAAEFNIILTWQAGAKLV